MVFEVKYRATSQVLLPNVHFLRFIIIQTLYTSINVR